MAMKLRLFGAAALTLAAPTCRTVGRPVPSVGVHAPPTCCRLNVVNRARRGNCDPLTALGALPWRAAAETSGCAKVSCDRGAAPEADPDLPPRRL